MSSYSSGDGAMALTITFRLGTDLDQAQVLVQNRVSIAEPRLPEEVRRLGITTAKSSPDLMMVVHMLSPDDTYDQLYVSNYARSRMRDVLLRLDGVGDVHHLRRARIFAAHLARSGKAVGLRHDRRRRRRVAARAERAGVRRLDRRAADRRAASAFQYTVTTQGRFDDARDFRYVIVKSTEDGRLISLQDVARIELGAKDYVTNSYLNGKPAVALGIFQRPGTNALAAAEEIQATIKRALAPISRAGSPMRSSTTRPNSSPKSINEVYKTIVEAILLVVIVIIVFLQSWRMAIVPIVAIPVSLIGTLAVLYGFGFSLNMLTLFGLVLAIGIVVDDAIVVVENVERNIARGLVAARGRASHHGRGRHGGARHLAGADRGVRADGLHPGHFRAVLPAVRDHHRGLDGDLGVQLADACRRRWPPCCSSRTMSSQRRHASSWRAAAERWPTASTTASTGSSHVYARMVRVLVGSTIALVAMLAVFAGLIYATVHMLQTVPRGFIPTMDQGYAIVVVQLPEGASLGRTDAVIQKASEIIRNTPGVANAVAFAGFSGATFTNASNAGVIFAPFESFEHRLETGPICRQDHRRPVRQPAEHPGGLHHRAAAAAGARHRQCRRLQDDAAGAQQRRHAADPGARLRDRRQGQPDARPDRRLHHLLGVEPAVLPGDRPRQGAHAERADPQHLRDAVDQSRHRLCQRLQRLRPRLPGAGAGRPGVPHRARRHPQAEGALGHRRAGAARHAGRDPRRHRPVAGAALQHVCLGAAAGQRRAGRLDRHARST